MQTKRDISIDLIKSIAIVFVVIIHSCTFSSPVLSLGWMSSLLWRLVSGSAVPLFLMASGAVMLSHERNLSYKKLYFKNILRIIIAMLFWGFAYKLYHLYDAGMVNGENILKALKELVFFNHEFHFYYMHMILIVYIFLPVTRTIAAASSKNGLLYFLILWFAFAIVYPTVWRYYPFNNFGGMTTMYGINLTYASIGYGVLGYYLRKYPVKRMYSAVLFASGFVLSFGLTCFKSAEADVLYEHFLAGNGVPVCLMAAGLFSFIASVEFKETPASKAISYISKSSFCIYLVHMLVMYVLKNNAVDTSFAPKIVSIPVYAFVILMISIAIYFVLSKIPLIKKWLI
ncbi:MAG: acyltransferase family protein [Clostridia bacterium]|nr:acyltransferase family protein [Clostridia bacterium]